MQYTRKGKAILFIALATFIICYQQSLTADQSSPDYKITRLRRKNIKNPPYIFGNLEHHREDGFRRPIGGCVSIDKKVTLCAEDDGRYACPLAPGYHELYASYLGSFVVRIKRLELRAGDSVRINFYLRDNPQPIY